MSGATTASTCVDGAALKEIAGRPLVAHNSETDPLKGAQLAGLDCLDAASKVLGLISRTAASLRKRSGWSRRAVDLESAG
jgi:hypothetical protein